LSDTKSPRNSESSFDADYASFTGTFTSDDGVYHGEWDGVRQ
jgi:hypothetical protein